MAPKKPTKQPKKRNKGGKKKYKVRNWREYNESLVNRGRLVFHITQEAIEQWEERKRTGKRGRPQNYSDTAIETALSVGQLLRLPLRQAEGLLSQILEKLDAGISAPDYSTVSQRSPALPVRIRARPLRNESIHLVVDASGAKVYGEGEWKVRKHGWSKRRTWQKVHLGVDEATGDILFGEATGNDCHDGEALPGMLAQLPPETSLRAVSADGAYDTRRCYEALSGRNVDRIAIPPQKNAKILRHGNRRDALHPRDENLRRIRAVGRRKWKRESGYHRRSLAENAVYRLKTAFGDRVTARTPDGQRTQLLLRLRLLNKMTMCGMPQSCVVD